MVKAADEGLTAAEQFDARAASSLARPGVAPLTSSPHENLRQSRLNTSEAPGQLQIILSCGDGLQSRPDDCRLSRISCGPEVEDRCRSCGPEHALMAIPTHFDCCPLQLATPPGQRRPSSVGRRSAVPVRPVEPRRWPPGPQCRARCNRSLAAPPGCAGRDRAAGAGPRARSCCWRPERQRS
jgi:hypothetical protein